jgi:S-adenosylmethionine/arginine decarboxylase-like enzyme
MIDARCTAMLPIEAIEEKITQLVHHIKMTPVGGPRTTEFPDGYTIVQIIEQSHIIVHTQENTMNIDIFSCKPYDTDKAKEFCIKVFNIREVVNVWVRNRKFGVEMDYEERVGHPI